MSFWRKIRGFLDSPEKAFDSVKDEEVGNSITYALKLLMVYSVLSSIVWTLAFTIILPVILSILESNPAFQMYPEVEILLTSPILKELISVMMFVAILIFGVISILFGGLWIHLWVYIIGGRKGLKQTIKSIAYGVTPQFLLGWIPFLGFAFGTWSMIVSIIGIRQYHEISTGKAIFAYLLGALIIPLAIVYIFYIPWLISRMHEISPIFSPL